MIANTDINSLKSLLNLISMYKRRLLISSLCFVLTGSIYIYLSDTLNEFREKIYNQLTTKGETVYADGRREEADEIFALANMTEPAGPLGATIPFDLTALATRLLSSARIG